VPVAQAAPADGDVSWTVGHGRTGPRLGTRDPGRPPQTPRVAVQRVVPMATCEQAYGRGLLDPGRHLCTEDPAGTGAQACAGDSGSPVLVPTAAGFTLTAVVAWGGEVRGRDCGQGLPDVSERLLPHADLLAAAAAPQPSIAPYAEQRVRVRRSGTQRLCVIGPWQPAGTTFTVRWWRLGPRRKVRDPRTGRQIIVPGGGVTRSVRRGRIGCSVTARTPGGWATEDSYNAL
jgi:hypothetical protein